MNVYLITEGITEKKVFKEWIKYINPDLIYVNNVKNINNNNIYILSGGGFPGYYDKIFRAIDEINERGNIDRLVISIDSEEMTYEEKLNEVLYKISSKRCKAEIKIVVQHYCIEVWALGNRNIYRNNPDNKELSLYQRFFNVKTDNPENLPCYDYEKFNRRAHFALRYLKLMLNERMMNYSKTDPKFISSENYFQQLKYRLEQTNHLGSLGVFLTALK